MHFCYKVVQLKLLFQERLTCLTNDKLKRMADTYCLLANLHTVTEGHTVYLTYYQWIPILLGLQACSFTLSHLFWSSVRGDHLQTLVDRFSDDKIDLRIIKKKSLLWAVKLYLCELLNTSNVICQFYIVNLFLIGNFLYYGSNAWIRGSYVLDEVFPKRAKCTFYTTGPSGTRQTHDSLCLLFHNFIYDKIFLIVWFLYVSLIILSLSLNIWRITSIFIPGHLHFKISLFSQIFYPYRSIVLNNLKLAKGLSHSDRLFVSYALSNLTNDEMFTAVDSLSKKLNRSDIEIDMMELENSEAFGNVN